MMTFSEYLRLQILESLSSENRWYCSEYYQREISDPEILFRYYIQHGGAENFAIRYRDKLDRAA